MYWTQVTYSFYMLKGWWGDINSLKKWENISVCRALLCVLTLATWFWILRKIFLLHYRIKKEKHFITSQDTDLTLFGEMHSCDVLKNTMLEGSVSVSVSSVCRGFQLTYILAHTISADSQIKTHFSSAVATTPVIVHILQVFFLSVRQISQVFDGTVDVWLLNFKMATWITVHGHRF